MTFLEPVEPVITQRRKFKPAKGITITIEIPGERVRAKIEAVENFDLVVVEIISTPVNKSLEYRKGDTVCCRRDVNPLGLECWTAISERELQQAEAVARIRLQEQEKADAVEQERVAKIRSDHFELEAKIAARGRTVLGPRRNRVAKPAPEPVKKGKAK